MADGIKWRSLFKTRYDKIVLSSLNKLYTWQLKLSQKFVSQFSHRCGSQCCSYYIAGLCSAMVLSGHVLV